MIRGRSKQSNRGGVDGSDSKRIRSLLCSISKSRQGGGTREVMEVDDVEEVVLVLRRGRRSGYMPRNVNIPRWRNRRRRRSRRRDDYMSMDVASRRTRRRSTTRWLMRIRTCLKRKRTGFRRSTRETITAVRRRKTTRNSNRKRRFASFT